MELGGIHIKLLHWTKEQTGDRFFGVQRNPAEQMRREAPAATNSLVEMGEPRGWGKVGHEI